MGKSGPLNKLPVISNVRRPMLKDIHTELNWKDLKTNIGNASGVPDALLSLLSDDETIAEKAYWDIDNVVILQGDLSQAAEVLPIYLEELLIRSKYKEKVIELLFQIGNGSSLNKDLKEHCYNQVIQVYERVLAHPSIVDTKFETIILESLCTLKELHSDHV